MPDSIQIPNVTLPEIQPPAIDFPKPSQPAVVEKHCDCKIFRYAVKAVSGKPVVAADAAQNIVAPGNYFTAVNIHNPSNCRTVTFRWRVTIANRIGQPAGVVTSRQSFTLRPGHSVEIDTPDIFRATQLPFNKGFVVIDSPCELDVVAVYTAAPTQAAGQPLGSLVAFHTERVPARRVEDCRDDLRLDLGTGVAAWSVVSAVNLGGASLGVQTPLAAAVIENTALHPAWSPAQSGTKWIGLQGFANIPGTNLPGMVPGYYIFQTCFNLCSGFEKPTLDLKFLNDDEVRVWFNDTQIFLGGSHFSGTPTSLSVPSGLFLPGRNCLSFVVRNAQNNANPNPVGLNVKALMTAPRGACDDGDCCC